MLEKNLSLTQLYHGSVFAESAPDKIEGVSFQNSNVFPQTRQNHSCLVLL